MVDYKKMYFELFNAITQSVEELSKAQLTTEEIYISSTCDREPYCGQGQGQGQDLEGFALKRPQGLPPLTR